MFQELWVSVVRLGRQLVFSMELIFSYWLDICKYGDYALFEYFKSGCLKRPWGRRKVVSIEEVSSSAS